MIDANDGVQALLADCDPALLEPPINVIRLALHPGGLAPRIRNLATWRAHLLHQLDHRIDRTGGDPQLIALRTEVTGYPYPGGGGEEPPRPTDPVVLLELATDDALHLETFLPADDHTRRQLETSSGA